MNIYDILASKASDENYKDMTIYYDLENNRAYTFNDVYKLVNNYLEMFLQFDLKGKKKYVIVDNSIDSVVIFIALLKSGAIPALINKSDVLYDGNSHEEFVKELEEKYDYNEQFQNLKYDYIIANDYGSFSTPKEEMHQITEYIDKIENNEIEADCDFYLCTSGVTKGTGKLVPLKEKELIKRSLSKQKDYSILTTTSISSVSGIIYDVFRPIICNVKNYMLYKKSREKDRILKYVAQYHINKVLLPINVLDILNDDLKKYDFSSLDTLYLSGGISSYDLITKIREYLPNLKDNVIASMYGRTENYGDICVCHENNIKSLYINVIESSLDKLVYTYDKKHIYQTYLKDGVRVNEEIYMKYENDYYANYLSASEEVLDNVIIDGNGIIGEIVADGEYTGDLGLYLNNQLYVVGRKVDLVLIDGKQYLLPMYEQMFSNITGLKTAAIVNEQTNKIFVAVNYQIDPKLSDNFKRIIPVAKKCNELIDHLKIPVDYPLFVASDCFPKSTQMHKTKKTELKNLISRNDDFQYRINNYANSFIEKVENSIKFKYNKIVPVKYQNNEFVFSKNEISFDALKYLEKNYIGYTYIREDDESYYCGIDDCLLLDICPEYNSLDYVSRWPWKYSEKSNQLDSFNRKRDRNLHYYQLELVCILFESNDKYILKPYQIVADNNYGKKDKLIGEDIPIKNNNDDLTVYIPVTSTSNDYYSSCELQNELKEYSILLNYSYVVDKSNMDFCIDDGIENNRDIEEEIENNRDKFLQIRHALFNNEDGILTRYMAYQKSSWTASGRPPYEIIPKKNTVMFVKNLDEANQISDTILGYYRLELYEKLKLQGLIPDKDYNSQEQSRFMFDSAVVSLQRAFSDNVIGFIVIPKYYKEYSLCKRDDMELVNITKIQRIKRLYENIQKTRKMGIQSTDLSHVLDVKIDLSKLGLMFVAIGDNAKDLDYILNIIGDCNIIEWKNDEKVLIRGVKYEF